MTEEIAFSDWSKRLERSDQSSDLGDENGGDSATNSWLPAYGFHQPADLQQAFLQNKAIEFYSNDMVDAACSTNVLLETILEETSDDLRSETSESDYNSGLLTDSVSTVIHVPSYEKNHKGRNSYWNDRKGSTEINTDPGVQDDDDEDDFTDEEEEDDDDDEEDDDEEEDEEITNESEDGDPDDRVRRHAASDGYPSRTNSLLQFENLEKHYENIFQQQRPTADLYDLSGVYENRAPSRSWRFRSSSQPENLNHFHDIDDDNDSSSLSSTCSSSSSSLLSSDEILSSSHSSRYDSLSRRLSLRSFRSIDSLTSLHQKHEKEHELLHTAELSQSLNDNISKLHSQPPDEIPVPARGLYKTVECLSEIPSCGFRNETVAPRKEEAADADLCHQQPPKTRRSTENLSEDSGFGDHITKESKNACADQYPSTRGADTVPAVEEEPRPAEPDADDGQNATPREGRTPPLPPPPSFVDADAIFSCSGGGGAGSSWQSDPNLLNATFVICDGARGDVSWCDGADAADQCPVNEAADEMASRLTVASTPNLYHEQDDDPVYHYRGDQRLAADCGDSTVSLSRVYSLKRINFVSESELAPVGGRGSNVQIMTSFVSLTNGAPPHNGKGVHFCPVVAEVNWRDSYSSDSDVAEPLLDEGSDYEVPCDRSRSAPDVSMDREAEEREFSPPLDVLVEKLLSDSVTRRNERELEQRAQQRARLDLITSPPPSRGGAANNNNSKSSSSLNESSSSSWSSPSRTPLNASYHSAAFEGAMDSNSGGASGGPADKGSASSPTKSSPVGKLGGFFQRFSLKRLSGRKSKKKAAAAAAAPPVVVGVLPKAGNVEANSRIIPLTGDYEREGRTGEPRSGSVICSKPPLPPAPPPIGARRRPSEGGTSAQSTLDAATLKQPSLSQYSPQFGSDSQTTPTMLRKTAATAACIDRRSPSSPHRAAGGGLLETDIDSNVTLSTSNVSGVGNVTSSPANSKKSRSLLNLDNGRLSLLPSTAAKAAAATDAMKAAGGSPHHGCNDYRAKSMEFLLDKENQAAVKVLATNLLALKFDILPRFLHKPDEFFNPRPMLDLIYCLSYCGYTLLLLFILINSITYKISVGKHAPENELQKGNGERKMSEHELRVQRSLQKLNVPEWYKNSAVPAQGFILKRHSDAGQNAQQQHQRWNTNTLPSKTTSLSSLGPNLSIAPRSPTSSSITSPGHTHYSFSRWSTSRLNSGTNSSSTSPCGSARSSFNYRQPYLGWRSQEKLSKPRTPAERLAAGLLPQRSQNGSQQSSPSLTEVRSSIKEVTSAIVHYVSGTRDSSDRLSPSLRYYGDSSSRSTSPRGSTGRLCWLESSFVGSKPSNVPDTPSAVAENKVPSVQHDRAAAATSSADESYLNYSATNNNSQQKYCENQTYSNRINDGVNKVGTQCPCKLRANSGDAGGEGLNHASGKKLTVRLVVQCKYPKCGKFAEPAEAKRTFKVCHNCDFIYCSRECRQDHWEKHRKACLQSRISDLCHRVLNTVKSDPNLLLVASRVARRGFLEHGRGCVKYYFHSPQIGEQFVSGNPRYPEAAYVKWSDLEPNEMGNELHSAVVRICKSYNPDTRLVILVAVHVVSEVPSTGSVKWERQIICRYSKTKLSSDLISRNPSLCAVNKVANYPATLILTSLPGVAPTQKEREVNFTNIQRQLRQRGVSLRKQFPEVYKKLCDYVEGNPFTPTTIYPVDAASGKTFMCVIMPDAEPEKLDLIPKENSQVQTVDVSQSTASSSSDT